MTARTLVLLSLAACAAACNRSAPSESVPSPTASSAPAASAPAANAAPQARAASPGNDVRVIDRIDRTIPLPARQLSPSAPVDSGPNEALTIRSPATDRLPEGPQSFDVLTTGGFVVADPLRERVVMYDKDGHFERAIDVHMPAAFVTVAETGFRIVSATDGHDHSLDGEGQLIPAARAGLRGAQPGAIPAPARPTVTLESDQAGTIRWPAPREASTSQRADLTVRLESGTDRMASLQVLSQDAQAVYVTLESAEASGRSLESLGKIVRRYSPAGDLQLEVRKIPIDYYIVPNTEFRVSQGALYQMVPHADAVLIHVWNVR